jgi:molecular chaperone HscA
LLQISEPGQTPDPHQRRIAVGIDLGTTHSLVAAVRHGVAECLPDEQGRVLLPSWCATWTATAARSALTPGRPAEDPQNTIASVKRFMGRSLADVADAGACPTASSTSRAWWRCRHAGGEKSPVEVSAEILATLRYRAEDSFDDDLFGAVITVPAYFDDAQRQATKDAASWPA